MDVGARNGVTEVGQLARFVRAHGFEPNPTEFVKLQSGRTDAFLVHGVAPPPYRELTYWPFALGNRRGRSGFTVTPVPGSAGILPPDLERMREIVWKGRSYLRTLADDVFAGYETIEVELRTLDDFAQEHALDHVDYLKIDVEGSEYEVLEGTRALLPRTGVIRVETCFVPMRKGQKLFSHVDLLLREHGFDLLRYEIDPAQVGYKQRLTPVEDLHDSRVPDPHGQALCCDAIYVNREISDPDRSLAQAAVLLSRDYVDEALHVLRTRANVNDEHFLELLRRVQVAGPSVTLRRAGYRAVDRIVRLLQSGARAIRS